MGQWRRHTKLARVLVACAVAVSGVVAALAITPAGHGSTATSGGRGSTVRAPTTGVWTPISVVRPKVPVIGGAIPVDIDPLITRTDFNTILVPVGADRYRMTILNTSNVGAINSLQWYPPIGVRIVKLVGSTGGHCTLTGLTGFGGNQFPTVVLYPNIFCDKLDLKPPSCTCLGDGGAVTISFVADKNIAVDAGDLRMRSATLVFNRIPVQQPRSAGVRSVKRIVTPSSVESGGLTPRERSAAQRAMDGLQDSNISLQLVTTTKWLQSVPTTCRIRLVSRSPSTYKVYVFWIPWLAANPYVWLNMTVTNDPRTSTFHLGTTQPVLPGGTLNRNGRTINRLSVDTTLLSRYGPEQAREGREILAAHGGDVFAKPGAMCQVLKNGSLRLLPAS